jgi:hypothetical protein
MLFDLQRHPALARLIAQFGCHLAGGITRCHDNAGASNYEKNRHNTLAISAT